MLYGLREKKGVSGRPQFFAGERLFAFVAQERVALKLPAEVKYAKEAALFRQAARFVMSTAPPQARGRSRTTG